MLLLTMFRLYFIQLGSEVILLRAMVTQLLDLITQQVLESVAIQLVMESVAIQLVMVSVVKLLVLVLVPVAKLLVLVFKVKQVLVFKFKQLEASVILPWVKLLKSSITQLRLYSKKE